jgi:hypothetical protein
MSLDSRLRRAEASAGAVGVILAWLEGAHASATLPEYVAAGLAEKPSVVPLDKIIDDIVQRCRGLAPKYSRAGEEERRIATDALVLYHLALDLEDRASELALAGYHAAAHVRLRLEALLASRPRAHGAQEERSRLLGVWAGKGTDCLRQVRMEAHVRVTAQHWYFDGGEVRFSGTIAAAELTSVEVDLLALTLAKPPCVAAMAERPTQHDTPSDGEVRAEVAKALQLARVKAFAAMGDEERATAAMARLLSVERR